MANDEFGCSYSLEETLREIAGRAGARRALLINDCGRVLAAVGFSDPPDVARFALLVRGAVGVTRTIGGGHEVDAFVEIAVLPDEARVYARSIVGDRLLVTVFDSDERAACALGVDPDALVAMRRLLNAPDV